jgi:small-conductance mechanosensitive channel
MSFLQRNKLQPEQENNVMAAISNLNTGSDERKRLLGTLTTVPRLYYTLKGQSTSMQDLEQDLEHQIADLTERLRQARGASEAIEAAMAKLAGDPALTDEVNDTFARLDELKVI